MKAFVFSYGLMNMDCWSLICFI